MNPFLFSIVVIFLLMFGLYIASRFLKDNSIIDIFWGIGFCLVSTSLLLFYSSFTTQQVLLWAMVNLWGWRLGIYLFLRKSGTPEDARYAKWRKEWGSTEPWRSFLQIYLLQGSIMYLMCVPFIIILGETKQLNFIQPLLYTGMGIFLLGWLFETIADYQKNAFKKKHPNGLMNKGLWKFSRHPNYFGEVVAWWGLAISGIALGVPFWSVVSAFTITYLICFVSGIPMLEKAKKEDDQYAAYREKTSVFFPLPPKK